METGYSLELHLTGLIFLQPKGKEVLCTMHGEGGSGG